MLATSGIESVVRLWEPKPPEHEESTEVKDRVKVCSDNQKRMRVDPFEIMLMRMGFQVAMAQDVVHQAVQEHLNPSSSSSEHRQEGGRDDSESRRRSSGRSQDRRREEGGADESELDQGQVRWIEDPTSCRQS